jgi:hypothetical protein
VCEFSEGGARRGCVWWAAALELTVADRELRVRSVGGRFVDGGNRFFNGVDGGLCGWTGVVGAEGSQPAQGIPQTPSLGQLI